MSFLSSLVGLAVGAVTTPVNTFAQGTSEAMEITGAPLPLRGLAQSTAGLTDLVHAGGQRAAGSLEGVTMGGALEYVNGGLESMNNRLEMSRSINATSTADHGLDALLTAYGVEKQQYNGLDTGEEQTGQLASVAFVQPVQKSVESFMSI